MALTGWGSVMVANVLEIPISDFVSQKSKIHFENTIFIVNLAPNLDKTTILNKIRPSLWSDVTP